MKLVKCRKQIDLPVICLATLEKKKCKNQHSFFLSCVCSWQFFLRTAFQQPPMGSFMRFFVTVLVKKSISLKCRQFDEPSIGFPVVQKNSSFSTSIIVTATSNLQNKASNSNQNYSKHSSTKVFVFFTLNFKSKNRQISVSYCFFI